MHAPIRHRPLGRQVLPRRAGLAAALVLAAGAAAAATAPVSTAGTRATPSPDQPKPRSGGYQVEDVGETMIRAKCDEGGWVFVARKAPGAAASPVPAHGIPPERDAAIRAACRAVDFSK